MFVLKGEKKIACIFHGTVNMIFELSLTKQTSSLFVFDDMNFIKRSRARERVLYLRMVFQFLVVDSIQAFCFHPLPEHPCPVL